MMTCFGHTYGFITFLVTVRVIQENGSAEEIEMVNVDTMIDEMDDQINVTSIVASGANPNFCQDITTEFKVIFSSTSEFSIIMISSFKPISLADLFIHYCCNLYTFGLETNLL